MAPKYKPEPSAREAKEMLLDEVISRLTTNLSEDQRDELRATAKPIGSGQNRLEPPATTLRPLAPVHPRTPRAHTLSGEGASCGATPRQRTPSQPAASALSYVNEGKRRFHQIPSGTAKLVATPGSVTPAILDARRALRLARPLGGGALTDTSGEEAAGGLSGRRSDAEARVDAVLADLVSRLEYRVERLSKHFQARGGLLNELEFIDAVATDVLGNADAAGASPETLRALRAIFSRVDVFSSGAIPWQALTALLAASTPSGGVAGALTCYEEVALPNMPARAARHADRLFYMAPLNALLICDGRDPGATIYYPRKQGGDSASALPPPHQRLEGHGAPVLAAICSREMGLVITSGADAVLCWWDAAGASIGRKWKLRQRESVAEAQQALCWWAVGSTLFTGGVDGGVYPWHHPPDGSFMGRVEQGSSMGEAGSSRASITALVLVSGERSLLCSGSLDGFIRLWDVRGLPQQYGKPASCLLAYRAHDRGVVAADVSRWCGLLFTAGLDHTVKVWSPLSDHYITTFQEHTAPLVSLSAMEGTPQVITADEAGGVCVYDVRSLTCTQSFRVEVPRTFHLTWIATLPSHRQIVVAAHGLTCFEAEPLPHPERQPGLSGAVYNASSHTIATLAGHNITIWDASTGRLLRTFPASGRAAAAAEAAAAAAATSSSTSSATEKVAELYARRAVAPLTGADVDPLGRRLVVCDAAAEVHVLDFCTGRGLFSYKAHTAEATGVALCNHLGVVVSVSSDMSVTLHEDAPAPTAGIPSPGGAGGSNVGGGAPKPRRHASLHRADITCSALTPAAASWCRPGARLVTGSEDGALHLWNLDPRVGLHVIARLGEGATASAGGGTSSAAPTAHGDAVTAVAFLGAHPLLASADASGRVYLWHVGTGVNLPPGAPLLCRRLLTLLCPGRGANRYPPLESPPWLPEASVPVALVGSGADDRFLSRPTLDDQSEPPPGFFVTEVEGLSGADGEERGDAVATSASAALGGGVDGGRGRGSFLPQPADCGATCLAFLDEPPRLLIGDELGRISSWDVSEIVAAVREKPGSTARGWSAPRSLRASVGGLVPGATPRSARFDEQGRGACARADADAARLAGARVRLVNVWQAHPAEAALREVAEQPGAAAASLAVVALTPVPPCAAVLSCGADGMARVWAADGAPLGRLQRGLAVGGWQLRLCAEAAEAAAVKADLEARELRAALFSDELLHSRASVDARPPRPEPKPPELVSEKAAAARRTNGTMPGDSPPLTARPALEGFGLGRKPDPAGQRALTARLSQPSPRKTGVAARALFGTLHACDKTPSPADAAAARLQVLGVDMYNHRAR